MLGQALAIGGGVLNAIGASDAADAQREAALLQSNVTYSQRREEIRRLALEQDYTEGLARARAASTGVEEGGSPALYQNFVTMENRRRRKFAQNQAVEERKAIRAGAPGSSAGKIASASELLSGITAAIGMS